jgi:hypothetical protein
MTAGDAFTRCAVAWASSDQERAFRNLAKHVTLRHPTLPIMVGRGGFWSLAREAGSRAFSFMSAISVAWCLGVADYGDFALIQRHSRWR